MSEYSGVRIGKLKLKGDKKRKHRKHKRSREEAEVDSLVDVNDSERHGNWFEVNKFEQLTGSICLEFSPHQYVRALDNGNLILGAPHSEYEGPDQEEIFVAVRVSPSQVAIKTGYNKYLCVDSHRKVVGHSDAIGLKEQFEPIFQDGKLAIMAPNSCFISIDEQNSELPYLIAKSVTAKESEVVKVRTNINPELTRLERLNKEIPAEERGSLRDCEKNYVKKFQSFQDKKVRLNSAGVEVLKRAKNEGRLHEELLDRRSKMKSDKFCK